MSSTPPPPPPPASAPAGWYPTSPGQQGYWDGLKWTGDVAPLAPRAVSDDNSLALVAHLLGLFTSFLGPLVMYLVKRDESEVIEHHAREALNFQISLIVYAIGSFFLMLLLVGFLTILATMIIGIVFPIMGAVAANRGERYRYPLSIRFVS